MLSCQFIAVVFRPCSAHFYWAHLRMNIAGCSTIPQHYFQPPTTYTTVYSRIYSVTESSVWSRVFRFFTDHSGLRQSSKNKSSQDPSQQEHVLSVSYRFHLPTVSFLLTGTLIQSKQKISNALEEAQRNTPKAISKSIISLLCYWHNAFMEYSALWRAWGLDTVWVQLAALRSKCACMWSLPADSSLYLLLWFSTPQADVVNSFFFSFIVQNNWVYSSTTHHV